MWIKDVENGKNTKWLYLGSGSNNEWRLNDDDGTD